MTYASAALTILRYQEQNATRVRFIRPGKPDLLADPSTDHIEFDLGVFIIKKADGTTHIFTYEELTTILDY